GEGGNRSADRARAPLGHRSRSHRRLPAGAAEDGRGCRRPRLPAGSDRPGTVVNRGEVWWGEIRDVGRRPFLVMTRNAAIPVLNSVLAAPVTRTVRGLPTELVLGPEDGMPVE